MNSIHQHPRSPAVTLLEVLLAVAVFSVVLVAINGVFYGALRLRERTARAVEDLTPVEHAIAILKRDLLSAVPTNGPLSGPMTTSLATAGLGPQSGGLEFFTRSGIIDDLNPWGDAQKVAYYLRQPLDRTISGRELVRVATRNLLATEPELPVEELLLEGVQGIEFSFYDGTRWQQTWGTTTTVTSESAQSTMPQAVQVLIEFVPDEKHVRVPVQLIVPITVQTNSLPM